MGDCGWMPVELAGGMELSPFKLSHVFDFVMLIVSAIYKLTIICDVHRLSNKHIHCLFKCSSYALLFLLGYRLHLHVE